MNYLPAGLAIQDKRVLVVGGGNVALQKIQVLRAFTSRITVVATAVRAEIAAQRLAIKIKKYEKSDVRGFSLVFACTNNRELNAAIKKDANKRGALVNVVDDPSLCDFIMPAVYKKGYMTIAVSSDGRNVRKSVRWRDRIKKVFAP